AAGTRRSRAEGERWVVDPRRAEDLQAVVAEAFGGGAPAGVVALWGVDAPAADATTLDPPARPQGRPAVGSLPLRQAPPRAGWRGAPALLVGPGGRRSAAGAAAGARGGGRVWAPGRVAAFEPPELRCRGLALPAAVDVAADADAVLAELGEDGENEV